MGAQACPGRTMATTEAVLILRALFQHLDVAHRPLLEPVASERNAVFTVRPLGVKAMVSAAGAIAGMESKSAPHHAPLVMSNS